MSVILKGMLQGVIAKLTFWLLSAVCIVTGIAPDEWFAAVSDADKISIWVRAALFFVGTAIASLLILQSRVSKKETESNKTSEFEALPHPLIVTDVSELTPGTDEIRIRIKVTNVGDKTIRNIVAIHEWVTPMPSGQIHKIEGVNLPVASGRDSQKPHQLEMTLHPSQSDIFDVACVHGPPGFVLFETTRQQRRVSPNGEVIYTGGRVTLNRGRFWHQFIIHGADIQPTRVSCRMDNWSSPPKVDVRIG